MKFDILEIQKNIEERRLVVGQKFENFLLKKLDILQQYFNSFLNNKSSAFFGSLAIIIISILSGSNHDIGHISALYLDKSKEALSTSNTALLLAHIPYISGKILSLNNIIQSVLFYNLIGIFSLYISYKLLKRSEITNDQSIFNLIIFSFAIGFFLRVFTSSFNEILTHPTYFLTLSYPYLCYHLINKSNLKNHDQVLIGIIAGLIACLKINYLILIIFFEVREIIDQKFSKKDFFLRNLSSLFILLLFLLKTRAASDLDLGEKEISLFFIIKNDLFPLILLFSLCFFLTKKFTFLKDLFLFAFGCAAIVLSEANIDFDSRVILYSSALPALVVAIYLLIKNHYIDFKKNALLLLIILLIPIFDKHIFLLALDLVVFWWVFVLILKAGWKKDLLQSKIYKEPLSKIFLPHDLISWLYFITLTSISFGSIFLNQKLVNLFWIFFAAIFILLLKFQQKLYKENFKTEKLSKLYTASIFMVLSYFSSLHIQTIFIKNHNYTSPNYTSDQIVKIVKTFNKKEDNFLIISDEIWLSYPIINYLKKGFQLSQTLEPQDLKREINDKKTRLIFIKAKNNYYNKNCEISFLENSFRDQDFKENFLENYKFLNRIIAEEELEKKVDFFYNDSGEDLTKSNKIITNDIEIYIRK